MPEVVPLALAGAIAAAYATGVVRLYGREARWPVCRTSAAAVGLTCVAAAVLPPLSSHDETFPVHVAQHLLLSMAAPALLALSAPVTLGLRTLPAGPRRCILRGLRSRAVAVVTAPVVALTFNIGGLVLLYFTSLYARGLPFGADPSSTATWAPSSCTTAARSSTSPWRSPSWRSGTAPPAGSTTGCRDDSAAI